MKVVNIIFIHIFSMEKKTTFLLEIILFLKLIDYCLFGECDRNSPFLFNDVCVQSCEKENINSKLCIIDNKIIKSQYLNNIIYFKEDNLMYFNIEVSENNNLYYEVSSYPATNSRYFYILNHEGYGLLNRENPLYYIEINDPSTLGRYESNIFSFHLLSSTDDREYLISISKGDQLMEIYDFYLNKFYFKQTKEVFPEILYIFTIVGTHLKLKNNKNTYIIGLLGAEYSNSFPTYYFFLIKVNFTSLDITNNNLSLNTQKAKCSQATIISCYETSSEFIVCFFQNLELKYIMIVYDYNLIEKKSITIAEGIEKEGYDQLFFKCIHFFEDTGVFGYFNNDDNPIFLLQFKTYSKNDNLINDYHEILQIDDIFFNHHVTMSDMIKIEDKKFYYVGSSLNQEILYIISIYNYFNENFSIRIYSINIQNLNNYLLSTSIKVALYKNFLVLASKNEIYNYPSLIIFSYPNSTEIDLDLIDYLYNNDLIEINNLIINFEGEFIIENNLFGYEYSGIQIIENCNNSEIYLVDLNNDKINNYFLPKDENIKLLIPKSDIYFPFICKFKYSLVVTEPNYSEYNNYPIKVIHIGNGNDERAYFKKKYYFGKYNYYNIILSNELKSKDCEDICELCYSDDISNCVTCKYASLFEFNSKTKICQNDNIDDYSEEIINQKTNSNNEDIGYFKECNSTYFLNNLCKINDDLKDIILTNIQMDIQNHLLDSLISNVIGGEKKDIVVNNTNTIYQITSTDNQNNNKFNNISSIILGECENILKNIYNIKNQSLIIFKIDYYKVGSLIPIIGYEVFHPENKTKLDLKYCKNKIVNFSIPVSIDEDNLFKYDPNNEYYTDQCIPYTTEKDTDILLNDRQNEYNENNLSICENICKLNTYNTNTKKVICDCEIKYKQIIISEIINQTDILYYNFNIKDESTNISPMKCYNILFTKEGMLTNIANFILLFTLILFIISAILFYKCGYHFLEKTITEILSLKNDNHKYNKINVKNNIQSINKNKIKNNKKTKKKNNNKKKKNKTKNLKEKNLQKSSSKFEFNYSKKIKIINNKQYLNNKSDYNPLFIDYELNSMKYKDALKFDKRSFHNYYISLIKSKHPIFFSFLPIKDYNSKIVKIDLFFLSFSIYYFVNSIFFEEKVIHEIYEEKGIYNFIYLIPYILYSFIISHFIFIFIKYFSLSERNIYQIKSISAIKANDLILKVKRCIIIKYNCFYILSIFFLTFFWYKLSSFGAVYKNTQKYLIKNTMLSFVFSLINPFIFNLIPCIIRNYSLKNPKRECFYKINRILQLI